MFSSNIVLLLCLCASLGTRVIGFRDDLYEGESCQMAETGENGICREMHQCQSAIEAYDKRRIRPQKCSFKRDVIVVCCVDTIANRIELLPEEARGKAEQMCECYHNYQNQSVEQCVNGGLSSRAQVGENFVDPRIKGGVNASSREFPHMVALGYESVDGTIDWACGGSLISSKHVLTAAHCLAKGRSLVRLVRIGDVNMRDEGASVNRQQFLVVNRTVHPDYSARTIYHDIAILTLNSSVTFSEYARPACLNTDVVRAPSLCIATGWGIDNWQSTAGSADLRKVELQVQPPSACTETFASLIGGNGRLSRGLTNNSMICAGDPEGLKDTCNGDSGGPIQVVSKKFADMHNIIGVTSFGTACGPATAPAIYTRVSSYVPWIVSVVWPEDTGAIGSGDSRTGAKGFGNTGTGAIGSGNSRTGVKGSGDTRTGARGSGDTHTGAIGFGNTGTGAIGSGDTRTGVRGSGDTRTGARNSGDSRTGARDFGDSLTDARDSGDSRSRATLLGRHPT